MLPQRLVLRLSSSIFDRDVKEEIKGIFIKFSEATRRGEPFKDILDRLVELASRSLMKLNKDKCKVPHLGRMSPCNTTSWERLAYREAPKAIRVLLGGKDEHGPPGTLAAKRPTVS